MKKLSISKQLAEEYVYANGAFVESVDHEINAFLAGWAARGRADLKAVETRLLLTSNLTDVGLYYTTAIRDIRVLDEQ